MGKFKGENSRLLKKCVTEKIFLFAAPPGLTSPGRDGLRCEARDLRPLIDRDRVISCRSPGLFVCRNRLAACRIYRDLLSSTRMQHDTRPQIWSVPIEYCSAKDFTHDEGKDLTSFFGISRKFGRVHLLSRAMFRPAKNVSGFDLPVAVEPVIGISGMWRSTWRRASTNAATCASPICEETGTLGYTWGTLWASKSLGRIPL